MKLNVNSDYDNYESNAIDSKMTHKTPDSIHVHIRRSQRAKSQKDRRTRTLKENILGTKFK